MKSAIAATLALAALAFAAPASALPGIPAAPAIETSNITPVLNGCGRGWHWSYRYRKCVRNWW